MLSVPAINEKATIQRARHFFKYDFQKLRALSLSRYRLGSGVPSLVAVAGGRQDTTERAQVAGVDADNIMKEVANVLDAMQPDYKKILELKYFNELSLAVICERLGYSHATVYVKLNQALLEFGLISGLAVIE